MKCVVCTAPTTNSLCNPCWDSYKEIPHKATIDAITWAAERTRGAVATHDWRFARWRELPEAERKIAMDLLNAAGHGERKANKTDERARSFWWALDCLEAVTDTLPPPKDPRLEAWRKLDAEERAYSTRRLAIAGRLGEVAAAALEALGEKP